MSKTNKTRPDNDNESFVALQETVVIGYADIAAAGCRTLLGVSGFKTEIPFEVPGLSTPPCCSTAESDAVKDGQSNENDLKPFLIYNCNYMLFLDPLCPSPVHSEIIPQGTVNQYDMEIILEDPGRTLFHVRRVIILSALRLDILEGPIRCMYENCWNGMSPLTSCHRLPPELKFSDAFLSNLMQMFMIEGIAFSCLTCPANKAESGQANDIDGSLEVIATMQQYLGDISLLGFSLDNSQSLVYKGNPGENSDMVAAIYV